MNNTGNKNMPIFPDILPSSIAESRSRDFEAGDFKTKNDIDELIKLLFEEQECSFYYFSQKDKCDIDGPLLEAKNNGDILMNETEFFYYRHSDSDRDFVKIEIRDGNYQLEWQKNIVEKGPMFTRRTLKLSQRKRTELETLQKIIMEENFRKQKPALINNDIKSEVNDSDLFPQNPWQAYLHIIESMGRPWKKPLLIFGLFFIVFFTIWTALPEKNKIEILDFTRPHGFDNHAPELVKPANGQSFNHYPRTTALEWKSLPGAVRYIVEVELQDIKTGEWHPIPSCRNRQAVEETRLTINFTGAQPGRWRVMAINDHGQRSKATDWWEFFYTQ